MPFPKINGETWEKVCPKEVFCDPETARKFLAKTLETLEKTNPHLFEFLHGLAFTAERTSLVKEAHFDAANAGAALCQMLLVENTLPLVSKETVDRVIEEFEQSPVSFHHQMMHSQLELYAMFAVAVCSGNYDVQGYDEEKFFVQSSALQVYKMIEYQCG